MEKISKQLVEGKSKIHPYIRSRILINDEVWGGGKKYGTPSTEFLKISRKILNSQLPANARLVLPTMRQIENMLCFK